MYIYSLHTYRAVQVPTLTMAYAWERCFKMWSVRISEDKHIRLVSKTLPLDLIPTLVSVGALLIDAYFHPLLDNNDVHNEMNVGQIGAVTD